MVVSREPCYNCMVDLPALQLMMNPDVFREMLTTGRVPEGFSADVVAFDLNSLLHNQLRRAADEPHAIKLTFQKLHATLRCVRPESTVLLAIDGSGPMAKMATQQSRRRKTASKRAPKEEVLRG